MKGFWVSGHGLDLYYTFIYITYVSSVPSQVDDLSYLFLPYYHITIIILGLDFFFLTWG